MDSTLPVADALFGKTRQAVLAILFGNPGHAYYTREIVHAADCGASQVQRELEQLTQAGLITRLPRANQVYFQANEAASIYPELVALVAKTFGIGDFFRKALVPYATRIQSAFIYGSVASGEHHATSDVGSRRRIARGREENCSTGFGDGHGSQGVRPAQESQGSLSADSPA